MKPLLRPERRRDIIRPFGWIPLGLLHTPVWSALDADSKLLYLVLSVLVDRQGQTSYGPARLATFSGLLPETITRARARLCEADLLAHDPSSGQMQLLSLPGLPEKHGVDTLANRNAEFTRAAAAAPPDRLAPGHAPPLSPDAIRTFITSLARSCAPERLRPRSFLSEHPRPQRTST